MGRKSIPKEIQAQIFVRDLWCCRYCGIEVFFSQALRVIENLSPNHGYWDRHGNKNRMSKLLLSRCTAIDHIIPVSRGGTNELNNLICACWECNTSKNNHSPEVWQNRMIEIEDLKVAENWDGFLSILMKFEPENEWLRYFNNRKKRL